MAKVTNGSGNIAEYVVSLDVETMGLYGEPFAYAACVYDLQLEKVTLQLMGKCPVDKAMGHPDEREWVFANVVPALACEVPPIKDCAAPTVRIFKDPEELRMGFIDFWRNYGQKSVILVDHGYPVESEFLQNCFMEAHMARKEFPPIYPLLDLCSMKAGAGHDPLVTDPRLPTQLPAHHPLADCRQTLDLSYPYLKTIFGDAK